MKDAADYAVYAGHHIPDSQLVDAALICINYMDAFKPAYIQFKCEVDNSYAELQ